MLFDAAGPLIRPAAPVGETYAAAARALGVTLPADRLDDAFRRILASTPPMVYAGKASAEILQGERDWWRSVVRGTFLAADACTAGIDLGGCFDQLWSHYARGSAWRLCPGARQALGLLRARGLQIGLASNFDHRLIKIIQELEIVELFDSITIPFHCLTRKPARGFFDAALRALGAACAETVYVGDDPERDLAAARRAGLRALDVREHRDLVEVAEQLTGRGQPLP